MHLVLTTRVDQSLSHVWAGFNRTLFERLNPPFPPVKVVRFDGCLPGDQVQVQLNFLLFRQDWISLITSQKTTDDEISFVDQGTKLPFFLAYWHHHHRLRRTPDDRTIIIDDITFRTSYFLTDYLLFPIMWLQFVYRKPIYRRFFRQPD